MFNLEQSITTWRQQMLAAGIKTTKSLDELENHLREEVEKQRKLEQKPEQAFEKAVQQIGEAKALETEFKKNEKEKHIIELACAAAVCLLSVYGGFFVIYWSFIDLQSPPGEEYRAGATGVLLLGLLMVAAASRALFICIRKMKERHA